MLLISTENAPTPSQYKPWPFALCSPYDVLLNRWMYSQTHIKTLYQFLLRNMIREDMANIITLPISKMVGAST